MPSAGRPQGSVVHAFLISITPINGRGSGKVVKEISPSHWLFGDNELKLQEFALGKNSPIPYLKRHKVWSRCWLDRSSSSRVCTLGEVCCAPPGILSHLLVSEALGNIPHCGSWTFQSKTAQNTLELMASNYSKYPNTSNGRQSKTTDNVLHGNNCRTMP